jgi:hypothetical protein
MSKIPNEDLTSRQIARAAGTVMAAILLGQLLGLFRGILVARAFPASELDAFFAANRVSETLFMLVAAGALSSAFIPTFTGLLAQGKQQSAWRLASALANIILIVLGTLTLFAGIFAPVIVRYLLAPGFSTDPTRFELTVELLRLQLASVLLFGLGGLLVGVLNAHHVFFIPALTPSMYQIGLIFGVLVLGPWMGIRGLAWGVVIGAFFYLLLQIPPLLKLPEPDKYLACIKNATRQRSRSAIRFFPDAHGPSGYCAVSRHRCHANVFRPTCTGKAGGTPSIAYRCPAWSSNSGCTSKRRPDHPKDSYSGYAVPARAIRPEYDIHGLLGIVVVFSRAHRSLDAGGAHPSLLRPA